MKNNYYTPKEIKEITKNSMDNVYRWLREHKLESRKAPKASYEILKTPANEKFIKAHKK